MVEVLGRGFVSELVSNSNRPRTSGTVLRSKVGDAGFEVAIKIVSQTNKKVQMELEKEIDVLKKCKHPNVVAYYGTYLKDDEVWIIMVSMVPICSLIQQDYCGAGSLKDVMRLAQDTLTERQAKYVLAGTAKGLLCLHNMKILHLDIKSANILLTDAGDVKLGTLAPSLFVLTALADFGVSMQLSTNSSFIAATDYVGSPLFMAPEVIKKDKYNSSADIWSLGMLQILTLELTSKGITMIEMIEGRPPNTDINCIEMLPLLIDREPPTLRDNSSLYTPEFHNIIAKCLQKDPTARPTCIDLLAVRYPRLPSPLHVLL